MNPTPALGLVSAAVVDVILDDVPVPVGHREIWCPKHHLVGVLMEYKAKEQDVGTAGDVTVWESKAVMGRDVGEARRQDGLDQPDEVVRRDDLLPSSSDSLNGRDPECVLVKKDHGHELDVALLEDVVHPELDPSCGSLPSSYVAEELPDLRTLKICRGSPK